MAAARALAGFRTTARTSCPAAPAAPKQCEPTNPEAPVMATFTPRPPCSTPTGNGTARDPACHEGPGASRATLPLIIVVLGFVAAATGVVQTSAVGSFVLAGFTGLAAVLADRHRDR
ncbi:MAG: hypothetical protein Ct9H300mP31_18040 [Acidimicrobiaceae bacterium]|nr:MAG: hypothetical protein Ct9H300mP31_18040 [Acidimicrobiaceae bacterium]